ncbi:hypothetical protein LSUCC0246_04700 [Rhodobacterales bacterium LSUCC0246]|nr:hypothetical protein [Rhodobacterales bacterium LSUCC0374]
MTTCSAWWYGKMTDVMTVLRFEEPARFDPDRLERLCREIGKTQNMKSLWG